MSYANPLTVGYRVKAADLTSAGLIDRIVGPKGMRGVVAGIQSVVTTGVTGSGSSISVSSDVGGEVITPYAELKIPVSSANAVGNDYTPGPDHEIAADEVVDISSSGQSTAGAADVTVIINWY